MEGLGKAAVEAASVLALAGTEKKNMALSAAAAAVRARRGEILAANERDMSAARAAKLSGALLDRLKLDEKRVEGIARSIEEMSGASGSDRDRRGGVGAAQRVAHSARARAAGRDRHHL